MRALDFATTCRRVQPSQPSHVVSLVPARRYSSSSAGCVIHMISSTMPSRPIVLYVRRDTRIGYLACCRQRLARRRRRSRLRVLSALGLNLVRRRSCLSFEAHAHSISPLLAQLCLGKHGSLCTTWSPRASLCCYVRMGSMFTAVTGYEPRFSAVLVLMPGASRSDVFGCPTQAFQVSRTAFLLTDIFLARQAEF